MTLIDKVKTVAATNVATVGYETLLVLLVNGATGASNYAGTAAEAATLKAGITVNVSPNADGSGAAEIADEYVKVRTQAGTKNAFLEVVLTDAYVASTTLPDGVTAVSRFLTSPSNSEV